MIYGLGTQAQRVVDTLKRRILSGEFKIGSKLPPHTQLAVDFGCAPLTVRHALSHLEDAGFISRQQGRGTFVQMPVAQQILLVDDDPEALELLDRYVKARGHQTIKRDNPTEALEVLTHNHNVGLVISDVRMPDASDGINFIRTVRQRFPQLPLAALTGYPDDLAILHGTPECPILILAKPVFADHVLAALKMALN
jgi:CheY-like chemotaxis protein